MGKLDCLRSDRPSLFLDLCLLVKVHLNDAVVDLDVYSGGRVGSNQLDSGFKLLEAIDLSVGSACHLT
jgi:hypothetical protein